MENWVATSLGFLPVPIATPGKRSRPYLTKDSSAMLAYSQICPISTNLELDCTRASNGGWVGQALVKLQHPLRCISVKESDIHVEDCR
jgi:hypothetical protein